MARVARFVGLLIVNRKVKDAFVFWTGMSWTVKPHRGIKTLLLLLFMASKRLVSEEIYLQLDPRLTTLKNKHVLYF